MLQTCTHCINVQVDEGQEARLLALEAANEALREELQQIQAGNGQVRSHPNV